MLGKGSDVGLHEDILIYVLSMFYYYAGKVLLVKRLLYLYVRDLFAFYTKTYKIKSHILYSHSLFSFQLCRKISSLGIIMSTVKPGLYVH